MGDSDLIRHVTMRDDCAELDHFGAIADLTDTAPTEWAEADGPDSRVGVSYWYINEKRNLTAYISNDQQHVSIQVRDEEGDPIAIAEIDLNELELEEVRHA